MTHRGRILETEVIDGEQTTRVREIDETGEFRDLSITTGKHQRVRLELEDRGHELVMPTASRVPQDFASIERAHARRWEKTQMIGNRTLGFIYGAGTAYLLWLIAKWVEVGGL